MPESEALDVLLLAGRMEIRGSCGYTVRLAQRLADWGVAATLISPDLKLLEPKVRQQLRCREYRQTDFPLWGTFVRWCLLHDLRQRPPALIHVQSRRALKLGNWLARQLDVPLALTVHDHLVSRERLAIDRRLCRKIIAVSPSVRDDLVDRQGFPQKLVTVIAGGVEIPPRPEGQAPLDPRHIAVVGTAGPLETIKGMPYFLGAARLVHDIRPDLEFVVAGSGPEEASLRRIARELGIAEMVTFVPYVRDFTESLEAMDVFCLPSLQQGLGTIMLEAMALGRPVIASRVGGITGILRDGETGLTVPPSDSAALARRILELIDNPARAQAIGAAARRLVAEDYNVDRMVLQTAELYHEISACQPKLSPLAPN
ncbi:MAG: glycosyltransferase family 1 protein [Planctomycetaceae bacterium]|nr:glycosyltransferase family 1 protein [Planctomycetaceae bacterium]